MSRFTFCGTFCGVRILGNVFRQQAPPALIDIGLTADLPRDLHTEPRNPKSQTKDVVERQPDNGISGISSGVGHIVLVSLQFQLNGKLHHFRERRN